MKRALSIILLISTIILKSQNLCAQKDVTQFLGIPVDGFKDAMIEKLKVKGYKASSVKNDILTGEFNGSDVLIIIATNNNKVRRVALKDVNAQNETDIKIRFNTLVRQFQANKNYDSLSDSTILKYLIKDDEDISYEMSVKKKRYQASFYQLPLNYDALTEEKDRLIKKKDLDEKDKEDLSNLMSKLLATVNKSVWFMISNDGYDKYYITIFYDNVYNSANGEDL